MSSSRKNLPTYNDAPLDVKENLQRISMMYSGKKSGIDEEFRNKIIQVYKEAVKAKTLTEALGGIGRRTNE